MKERRKLIYLLYIWFFFRAFNLQKKINDYHTILILLLMMEIEYSYDTPTQVIAEICILRERGLTQEAIA